MVMINLSRAFPLVVSLLLLSACNRGGKDDASDSTPPPPPPTRGQLLTKPAPLVKSYSTTDLLALLGGSDVGKELLSLAYTPKCGVVVFLLSFVSVGGLFVAAFAS